MAERIDIIVSAAQRGGGGAGTPGQSPRIPTIPDPTPQAREGIEGLAQGVLGLQSAFQGLAVVAVGQQLVGFGVSAGQAALQLEKVESTARLLSGSTRQYNDLVALARENQKLFGGSLAENIQGLSGFANTARRTGIEIETFNDLAQRLNLLSPEQGLEGAAIALKEALAGDTQSLRERFELDRTALQGLTKEGITTAERVAILNTILEDQGVAAGAAAGSVSNTAKAYNELGAAADNAKTALGKLLAEGFAPAARGAARVLSGDWDTLNEVVRLTFEEVERGKARLVGLEGGWLAAGDSIRYYAEGVGLIPPVPEWGGMGGGGGDWTTEPLQAADANAELSASMDLAGIAASRQKAALDDAARAAYEARDAGGGLTAQANAAARALLAAGADGAAAAAQLAGSSSQVDVMTAAQYRLMAAAQAAQGAMAARIVSDKSDVNYLGPEAAAARQRQQWEEEYQDTLTRTTGTTAQRLALARQELAATAQYSDARIAAAAEVARLEQQLGQEQQAAADKSASRAKSAADKAAREAKAAADKEQRERERRQEEIDRALERIEDRTEDHYRRLRTAQEDYALDASRDEEDYQRQRQRLLAEGRIREAQLLDEERAIDRRRAAEDAARSRERATEDYARDIAEIREGAQLDGTERRSPRAAPVAVGAPAAAGASAGPAPAAASAGGAGVLRLAFAPLQILLSGERVADVLWQALEVRMDEALSTGIMLAGTVAPAAGGQSAGVGGPRP